MESFTVFAHIGIVATASIAAATVFVWILGQVARTIYTSVSLTLGLRRHMYLTQDDLCFDFFFPLDEGKKKEYTDFLLLGAKDKRYYRIGAISERPISFSSSVNVGEAGAGFVFKKTSKDAGEVTVRFSPLFEDDLKSYDGFYLVMRENKKRLIAKIDGVFSTDIQQLLFRRAKKNLRIYKAGTDELVQ